MMRTEGLHRKINPVEISRSKQMRKNKIYKRKLVMYVYESIHAWLVHTAPNIVSCSHAWQLILSRYVTSVAIEFACLGRWIRLRCSEIPRGDSPRPYRQSILRPVGGNTETLNPRGLIIESPLATST